MATRETVEGGDPKGVQYILEELPKLFKISTTYTFSYGDPGCCLELTRKEKLGKQAVQAVQRLIYFFPKEDATFCLYLKRGT
jgi:hypothetical protein